MPRHGNIVIFLLYLSSFWAIAPFMKRSDVFDLMHGLSIALLAGILVGWAPSLWHIAKKRWQEWSSGHFLIWGVWVILAGLTGHIFARIYWRWIDNSEVLHSLLVAWSSWAVIGGAVLCLNTNGVSEGRVSGTQWFRTGRWVAAGLAFAAISIVFLSDFSGSAN